MQRTLKDQYWCVYTVQSLVKTQQVYLVDPNVSTDYLKSTPSSNDFDYEEVRKQKWTIYIGISKNDIVKFQETY